MKKNPKQRTAPIANAIMWIESGVIIFLCPLTQSITDPYWAIKTNLLTNRQRLS